jgi:hypothetical protein
MDCELLRHAGGAVPDRDGMVGHNRERYRSPAFQRFACRTLIYGVACNAPRYVGEAFRAIEATFARQSPAGHFGGRASAGGTAFWLCELNQALLLLEGVPGLDSYRERAKAFEPGIARAATWLSNPARIKELETHDAQAPNRLLFDGLAFALSGVLLQNTGLRIRGERFVDKAMERFRHSDGVFLEKGGHDSSYQAVAAWLLQVWVLHFPDTDIAAAADAACRWLVGRIAEDGSVNTEGNTRTGAGQEIWMGKPKQVNYHEVLRCLLYYTARCRLRGNPDANADAAVQRLAERIARAARP